MSTSILDTAFAGGTFVVIAVTAVAASVQLRHLRSSNQLIALTTVLADWRQPQLQAWFTYVRTELPERLRDDRFIAELKGAQHLDRVRHPEVALCDYFEQLGCYVKYSLIDKASLIDFFGGPILVSWLSLLPFVDVLRKARGEDLYENYEYLATECLLWIKRHPNGVYPKRFPRFAEVHEGDQFSAASSSADRAEP
jgi:hypothetical protein